MTFDELDSRLREIQAHTEVRTGRVRLRDAAGRWMSQPDPDNDVIDATSDDNGNGDTDTVRDVLKFLTSTGFKWFMAIFIVVWWVIAGITYAVRHDAQSTDDRTQTTFQTGARVLKAP